MPIGARFARRVSARATPLIVATALLMENLDSTVIATSLPAIAVDLNTGPIQLKLALTSYLLALAIFIPASGWMADRFGARRIFRWAIAVFAAGSIACGLSINLPTLVAARVLQGVGGAMMVPVARLIVLRSTPKADFVNAMAWLTVPALIGPVLGPPLGGFITTYFHWRWIFWINIPIAVIGIALTTRFIPKLAPEPVSGFDTRGFLLVGPGLAGFLSGVTLSGLGIAPVEVIAGLMIGGLTLLVLYVRHAMRAPRPLVNLRLLRFLTFRVNVTGGTIFRVGAGGLPFLLPLMYQIGFGLTAFQSGMLTFVSGVGAIAMKFVAQPILNRFGFRRTLAFNAILAGVFMAAPATFTVHTPYTLMMLALFFGGVCRSLQFTALNALAYSEIEPPLMSSATSFNAVLQQLSASVGITFAAFGLEAVNAWTGSGAVTAASFPPVFVLIAGLSTVSVLVFARLTPTAGAVLLSPSRPT